MGTRSAIGYVRPDGTIRAVYCHWDGYPSHHLPILKVYYNTLEKAKKLIKPGSMSSLRTTHTWESDTIPDKNGRFGTKQDENGNTVYTHTREPQPLYHAERGDNGPWNATGGSYGEPPVTFAGPTECGTHFESQCCEHIYLYRPRLGWFHYPLDGCALSAFFPAK